MARRGEKSPCFSVNGRSDPVNGGRYRVSGYGTDEIAPIIVQVLNGEPPANTAPVLVNILPGVQFRHSGGGNTVGQLLVTDAPPYNLRNAHSRE